MRRTRILSVALFNPTDEDDPDERVRVNLENILAMLDRAKGYDPDFVCFPEACLQHAASGMLEDVAQPIPGPATDAVGEKAAELDSYVVLPMYERDGDAFYNAAAFIDPDGDVVGTYRKVAPTDGEMDNGITPGGEVPAWDTPFGRVGIAICWDNRYPEVGTRLRAEGVNLLFFPTHGTGHHQMMQWAQYNGYHVALCDKHDAKVYTPYRSVLAEVGDEWKNPEVEDADLRGGRAWLSFAEVNTDCKSYHKASETAWDWPNEIAREYPGSTQFSAQPGDGIFVLESLDEDLSLEDLEAEFDMETVAEYEEGVRRRVHEETGAGSSPLVRLDGGESVPASLDDD